MMLNNQKIDAAYLTKWSRALGVEELLQSAKKHE
jgi:hypothetical protein